MAAPLALTGLQAFLSDSFYCYQFTRELAKGLPEKNIYCSLAVNKINPSLLKSFNNGGLYNPKKDLKSPQCYKAKENEI